MDRADNERGESETKESIYKYGQAILIYFRFENSPEINGLWEFDPNRLLSDLPANAVGLV
jgi:hypothetical protein